MAVDAMGYPVEAIRLYREAIRLDPGRAEAWNNLAAANHRLGLAEAAASNLREAVRLRPEYPEAWFNLGLAYSRLGRHREAAGCLREALRQSPGFVRARELLASEERRLSTGR
jgi:tetratricopeptide (TPR) repeat protein